MRRIDFLHTIYPYMGSRKLAIMLQREGYSVSRKIVRRLMAEMGICAVYPRANLSKRNFKESIVPYLLRGVTPYFSQSGLVNRYYLHSPKIRAYVFDSNH